MKKLFQFIFGVFMCAHLGASEPIVTAEKFLDYKRARGVIGDFKAPEVVLVCYQSSTMAYLLKEHPEFEPSRAMRPLLCGSRKEDWHFGRLGSRRSRTCD